MEQRKHSTTVLCMIYDRMVGKLVELVLTKKGYNPILCSSGDEAIPRVLEADIVVSDYSCGGPTLYRHVRNTKPDVSFILLDGGGHGEIGDLTEVTKLPKPFLPSELVSIIERNLRNI